MNGKLLWLTSLCLLVACAASPKSVGEGGPQVLPENYFSSTSSCISSWSSLFASWEQNGGGVKNSIFLTRKQVANDKKSRFAAIVRKAWSLQKEPVRGVQLGSWPIEEKEEHRVIEYFYSSIGDAVPSECQIFDWVGSDLWREADRNKPEDVPGSLTWEPHQVSLWLGYWLFVRIE